MQTDLAQRVSGIPSSIHMHMWQSGLARNPQNPHNRSPARLSALGLPPVAKPPPPHVGAHGRAGAATKTDEHKIAKRPARACSTGFFFRRRCPGPAAGAVPRAMAVLGPGWDSSSNTFACLLHTSPHKVCG